MRDARPLARAYQICGFEWNEGAKLGIILLTRMALWPRSAPFTLQCVSHYYIFVAKQLVQTFSIPGAFDKFQRRGMDEGLLLASHSFSSGHLSSITGQITDRIQWQNGICTVKLKAEHF